jgi:sortase A
MRWSAPLLLFFVGISALGYCGYIVLDARNYEEDQSKRFDQALSEVRAAGAAYVAGTSALMPSFVETSGAATGSGAAIAGKNIPLGRIEITSIGLSAMIEEGTSTLALRRGVGHITGTALLGDPGNIGVAGHRDTFFRKLRNIHEGDEITLTTLAGSFAYRVELISIVEPQDSQVLRDSGEKLLTLVTCYPFSFVGPAPKRFIVRARQISDSATLSGAN